MSELVSQIISQMSSLSRQDRVELACVLVRSLEAEEEDTDQLWAEELERRVSEIQSGKAVGISATELFVELDGQ